MVDDATSSVIGSGLPCDLDSFCGSVLASSPRVVCPPEAWRLAPAARARCCSHDLHHRRPPRGSPGLPLGGHARDRGLSRSRRRLRMYVRPRLAQRAVRSDSSSEVVFTFGNEKWLRRVRSRECAGGDNGDCDTSNLSGTDFSATRPATCRGGKLWTQPGRQSLPASSSACACTCDNALNGSS